MLTSSTPAILRTKQIRHLHQLVQYMVWGFNKMLKTFTILIVLLGCLSAGEATAGIISQYIYTIAIPDDIIIRGWASKFIPAFLEGRQAFIMKAWLVKMLKKFIIFTLLLSLGGLPPFPGFLPKLIVIQTIITNNIAPLATIVVVTSLITLYYYLKISYSRFIILNTEPN